jgi:hypothetical protein
MCSCLARQSSYSGCAWKCAWNLDSWKKHRFESKLFVGLWECLFCLFGRTCFSERKIGGWAKLVFVRESLIGDGADMFPTSITNPVVGGGSTVW